MHSDKWGERMKESKAPGLSVSLRTLKKKGGNIPRALRAVANRGTSGQTPAALAVVPRGLSASGSAVAQLLPTDN